MLVLCDWCKKVLDTNTVENVVCDSCGRVIKKAQSIGPQFSITMKGMDIPCRCCNGIKVERINDTKIKCSDCGAEFLTISESFLEADSHTEEEVEQELTRLLESAFNELKKMVEY